MSDLTDYLADFHSRTDPFHQFRLIRIIKGVEFGSPVYTYAQMFAVLAANEFEHGDIDKILGRRAGAGAADWEVV